MQDPLVKLDYANQNIWEQIQWKLIQAKLIWVTWGVGVNQLGEPE